MAMATFKGCVSYFYEDMSILKIFLKFWIQAHFEVGWSGIAMLLKASFRQFVLEKH